MPGSLLALALQVGPFYQQRPADDYYAVRPFVSVEQETTDVLWPLFTCHEDWWRFAYIAYWLDSKDDDSYQFALLPLWFNGRTGNEVRGTEDGECYWGLFPVYGYHPHVATLYDLRFALWPLWHSYRKPRGREWMTTNAILFPFISWRDDGSWGFWPLYGVNHQRESDHRYFLWPIATWACYKEDRDTAGAGHSWMFWPLCGAVSRENEDQWLFLPPLFSWTEVKNRNSQGESGTRLRCPWPFFELESTSQRKRISVWPLYERVIDLAYADGKPSSTVTRFGWKLVELYDDETRVFPFWASGRGHWRLWPFWDAEEEKNVVRSRFLSLFPIRWVPAIDRNWSKFWTFYENESCPLYTDHSLFWGIIRWRTRK